MCASDFVVSAIDGKRRVARSYVTSLRGPNVTWGGGGVGGGWTGGGGGGDVSDGCLCAHAPCLFLISLMLSVANNLESVVNLLKPVLHWFQVSSIQAFLKVTSRLQLGSQLDWVPVQTVAVVFSV